MRKVYAFIAVSADGYFEGPERDIDWHVVDDEFTELAVDQLNRTGTLLFGRVTYELMASYWPTEAARHDDPRITALMNALPKLVASGTLTNPGWARLITGDVAGEVAALKHGDGGEIGIFGSSRLTVSLLRAGLVDEVRLMVMPVLLGSGHPVLEGATRSRLRLKSARPFRSGNILLTYQPEK